MFHASRPLTAAQARSYFDTEYSRGDYYTRGDNNVPGRWAGKLAHELGFSGDVRHADFLRLLDAQDHDGRQLLDLARATGARRVGWDFTVSADKSVSIAALVRGDGRLLEAHDRAVERALEEVEAHVQIRVRHGKDDALRERVTTGRMAAATFRHESSRALDPQLHTHVVIGNLTRRDDGEWRALEPVEMFRAQKLATATYRAEMARAVEALGYDAEVRKDGSVGIAGFTRDDLEAFSQRRAAVLKFVREHGKTTRELGQEAATQSRVAKQHDVDRDGLVSAWRERARERGLLDRDLSGGSRTAHRSPFEAARDAVDYAVEHLSERRAAFPVMDLERVALERGMGEVRLDTVRAALRERADIRRVGPIVTTDEAIDLEREVLERMRSGQGLGAVIKGDVVGGLSDEQAAAARHILATPDRVLGLEGRAGTGKSHVLGVVQDVAESAGWTVRAFAPTTSAVEVLRSGGLDAATVARLLREKDQPAVGPQLWVVDEAGLLSTRDMAELLRKAEATGAKVVLVGDRLQHRAIEAGQPFAQLVEGGMRTARLTEIRRQRDARLREAVREASSGAAGRAVLSLQRQGCLEQHAAQADRLQSAVEHSMRAPGSALVVTATNADRHELNHRIREARIAARQVERQSMTAHVLVSKDLTRAERGRAARFDVGDVVTFQSASRVHGVQAGRVGRVEGLDVKRNRLGVRLTDGRLLEYNPTRLRGVEVARLEERRFAVGDRLEFRRADTARGIVNGSLGSITALVRERGLASVTLDGGAVVPLDLRRPQAIDHGYVSTSFRSQGRTVDHTIAVVEAKHAQRELLYVAISRGRDSAVLITDDRDALVRRLQPSRDLTSALAVEQARLIAAAEAAFPAAQKEAVRWLSTSWPDRLEEAQEQRYEVQQRMRRDLDQVEHHGLLARRADLEQRVAAARPEARRGLDAALQAINDRLYVLRHGPRTELGPFRGRLRMSAEAQLHAAHRYLNALAAQTNMPELRSPLSAVGLAVLDAGRLLEVVNVADRAQQQFVPGGRIVDITPSTARSIVAELVTLLRQSRWPERSRSAERDCRRNGRAGARAGERFCHK